MQVNLLKNIVTSIVGGSAGGIVDLLYNKKNVNEFLIAKKLKLTINQTRNVLYRLADEGLVSFIRKKDTKKGGWYTYYWTLNSGKSLIKFRDTLIKNIETQQQQLAGRKSGRFYTCKNCLIEFSEETALLNNYTCSECGQVVELKDLSVENTHADKDLAKTRDLLEKVKEEVEIIILKENKARDRKHKAEAKKQKATRAAKKLATNKAAGGAVKPAKPLKSKKVKRASASSRKKKR